MITCQFENGNPANLRHITTGAIIVRENSILLTKRSDKLTDGGKYCLPGGFLNRDETIEEGVAREVLEETGRKVISSSLFYVSDNPHRGENQNICFFYRVKAGEQIQIPDWEVTEVTWFDLGSLPNKNMWAFDHDKVINLFIKIRDKKTFLFDHGSSTEVFDR